MKVRGALVEPLRQAVMLALLPLERRLLGAVESSRPRALFIVGPPRSGTTLLYQLVVRGLRLAYFSNLAHRFYRTPVAATRLAGRLATEWDGPLESRYGHVDGWAAPSEGGWIWQRWLAEPTPGPSPGARDPIRADDLRATLGALAERAGGPFVNKNVMHSTRIALLDSLLPGCLFVHVRRDPARNVQSILAARAHGGRRVGGWWSVPPSTARAYRDAPVLLQACAQVHDLHHDIERATRALGPRRRLEVRYEDLCASPGPTLVAIGGFLAEAGWAIERTREPPAALAQSTGPRDRDEGLERIREGLRRVAGARHDRTSPA